MNARSSEVARSSWNASPVSRRNERFQRMRHTFGVTNDVETPSISSRAKARPCSRCSAHIRRAIPRFKEPQYSSKPKMVISAPKPWATGSTRSRSRPSRRSSASTNRMYSPCARDRPALRAADTPLHSCWYTTRLSHRAEARLSTPIDSSVDPSSTQITSSSPTVCDSMEERHPSSQGAALCTGTMTLISIRRSCPPYHLFPTP